MRNILISHDRCDIILDKNKLTFVYDKSNTREQINKKNSN